MATNDNDVQATGGTEKHDHEKESSESSDEGDETREFIQPAADAPRKGLLHQLWPTGGRIFSALGLDRCTIL